MSNIKVSVVCLTYNHGMYISKTIDSLLMQEVNFNYEIIISDDCSTDNNQEIIKTYTDRFPNLIQPILHNRNIGMFKNTTETLKKCRGEFISFCEGDDYWTDQFKLQKQVDLLEENLEISLCYHKVLIPKINIDEDTFIIKDDLSTTFIPTCSVVFRNKERIINLYEKYARDVISGDQFLFYLCDFEGEIKFLNFIGGCYNQTAEGISKKIGIKSKKWNLNRVLMYSRLLTIAPMNKKMNLINVALSSLFNAMGHGISQPYLKHPFHALKIIILGSIFYPKYTLYRTKYLFAQIGK